ncbi:MAG: alpha-ribazole phosphatase family protein [Bacteroidales bacterium]|nr:alpha-ribazole phosphatase family protein [Bacteroidales bacterium]
MKLFLVRHTKPAIPGGICYGQTDIDVAEPFDRERGAILERLGNIMISQVFSSPLIRCTKLARSFVPHYGPVIYDDRLKEFNFGNWEMKPWSEIENEPGAKEWFLDYINIPVPGGEAFADLINRVRRFTLEVQKEFDDRHILIICHGGVIRAFDTIINGTDPLRAFDLKIDFGEVLEIEMKERI